MKNYIFIVLIVFMQFSFATTQHSSKSIEQLSIQELYDGIKEVLKERKDGSKNPHNDSLFVSYLEQILKNGNFSSYEYHDFEAWIVHLSEMKSLNAKRLFGSSLYRSGLDGALSETLWELSKETEFELNNIGKLVKYKFVLDEYNFIENYPTPEEYIFEDLILKNISASSQSSLSSYKNISYEPNNVTDLKLETAWIEGSQDYGIGESINFEFNNDAYIGGIILMNGYAKNSTTWDSNSRIKTIIMYINDKPKYQLLLLDTMKFQRVLFAPRWFKTNDKVKFEIIEIYPGTKYKDTAISELYFEFRP